MKTSRVSWCFKRIILSMQIQMDNIAFVNWSGMAVARHAFDSGLNFRLRKRCFFPFYFRVFVPIISSVVLDLCKARVQVWMRTSFRLLSREKRIISQHLSSWINSYWLSTSESDSSLAKTRSMQSMHDWHCVSVRMLAVFWLATMLSSVSVYFDTPEFNKK